MFVSSFTLENNRSASITLLNVGWHRCLGACSSWGSSGRILSILENQVLASNPLLKILYGDNIANKEVFLTNIYLLMMLYGEDNITPIDFSSHSLQFRVVYTSARLLIYSSCYLNKMMLQTFVVNSFKVARLLWNELHIMNIWVYCSSMLCMWTPNSILVYLLEAVNISLFCMSIFKHFNSI